MDAVQAITGSGGWPLNVFLTPDLKPFYGGTYFPPVRAYNRASWQETLQGILKAFSERRNEINEQAENLTAHLINSNSFGFQKAGNSDELFSKQKLQEAYDNMMKSADKEWGGFGKAPKFPQTFCIQFLLRYFHFINDRSALDQAILSLDKMIVGGIYDQLGGGFARYSTDTEWLVPHFEKMLYDNALLVIVLSEAYQLTKKKRYKEIIEETIGFVRRELLHPAKGFYSALDADSEGEEGKFYVWNKHEIQTFLGNDAEVFCDYYDITNQGNWEGENVLRIKKPLELFANEYGISAEALKEILEQGKIRLLEERHHRVRPMLDDKIILGWNALMNMACCKAYEATGNEDYKVLAVENMDFLIANFSSAVSTEFYHTWKDGQPKFPAFLDDYAFLIKALISLQEITADTRWLLKAKEITEWVVENFSEPETGFFFYTRANQEDVIFRKKEVYDGALPSGNSVMADIIYRLSILFDKKDWRQRTFEMLSSLGQAIIRYPTSFCYWNTILLEMAAGTVEIAIIGIDPNATLKDLLVNFIPNRVLMATSTENESFPLLAGKAVTPSTFIYVCKEFSCLKPVTSATIAMELIMSSNSLN
jgi:uncharacterized protein YyaL (SSP411 family)